MQTLQSEYDIVRYENNLLLTAVIVQVHGRASDHRSQCEVDVNKRIRRHSQQWRTQTGATAAAAPNPTRDTKKFLHVFQISVRMFCA